MSEAASLIEACRHVLLQNLALTDSNRLLVLTDHIKAGIGRALQAAGLEITKEVEFLEIQTLELNGQEPPPDAANAMLRNDVVVAPLSRSISWTKARKRATDQGVRIATMPGITEAIILRTFPIDYEAVRTRANRICDLLDSTSTVQVSSSLGTQIQFQVSGRLSHGRKGGIYSEEGFWGNLPCGEAFIAPVEESAQGKYIIDASVAAIGEPDFPIQVTITDGVATSIDGGEGAERLAATLTAVEDPSAFNFAEFGIGCNHGAVVNGTTLEDEKAMGTCHFALGSNEFFGGNTRVGIHIDGVIRQPTIYLDQRKIISNGEWLV